MPNDLDLPWLTQPTKSGHYWWLQSPKSTAQIVYVAVRDPRGVRLIGLGFDKSFAALVKNGESGRFQGPLQPRDVEKAFA